MSTPVLALKNGQNHRRDLETMATRSNSGLPWRNSTDSFRGQPLAAGEYIGTGHMSGPELEEFRQLMQDGKIEYVIRSYDTPVAWLVTGAPGHHAFWIITSTRYSNTTSQQVGRLYTLTDERYGHGLDAS